MHRVSVRPPCRAGSEEATQMVRQTAPAPAPRVLIVDPDEDTRLLHAITLRPLFADVEEAEDGAEALARAIARCPALIVSELRLPRLDGFALCTLLRREQATRGTPILIVTASALPVELDHARRAGADDVLVKPCSPEALVDRSRQLAFAARNADAAPADVRPAAPPPDTARVSARRRFIREVTTRPPLAPQELRCPRCDQLLAYEHSYIGGVNAARCEQWDHYRCGSCGRFAYRRRTRTLRPIP
jgi:CheY-like chemotaxis protein